VGEGKEMNKKCPFIKESVVKGYEQLHDPNPKFSHRNKAGIIFERLMDCIGADCMAWDDEKKKCNYFSKKNPMIITRRIKQ
jgi:hypothetical protein